MVEIFNSIGSIGLIANIAASVVSAVLMNAAIFSLGWDREQIDRSISTVPQPPRYIIGGVWVILFALMGTARWLLNSIEDPALRQQQQLWIVLLIVFCLIYPLYSLAINSRIGGLLGNFATIAFALFVSVQIRQSSLVATVLILAVLAWVSFATVLLIELIRLEGFDPPLRPIALAMAVNRVAVEYLTVWHR